MSLYLQGCLRFFSGNSSRVIPTICEYQVYINSIPKAKVTGDARKGSSEMDKDFNHPMKSNIALNHITIQ